ncbi:MAG: inositol-3-phosphate synthase [Desulfobacterales bacterium]|jgi:myo-inositol-1-phosphate synthase
MTISEHFQPRELLVLVAGLKGAIGTTVAALAEALKREPASVRSGLTTVGLFDELLPIDGIRVAGWDTCPEDIGRCVLRHRVLPETVERDYGEGLSRVPVRDAGAPGASVGDQVERILSDIQDFKNRWPDSLPVMVNLLPAAAAPPALEKLDLGELYRRVSWDTFPDPAYALAAIRAGIPLVNFTPNPVEVPPVVALAEEAGVPMAGRDGKTGQTYFKVVLAEALRTRGLYVDGWYSLNILGNEDGRNLMDPERARGKLANKTDILDRVLGYRVGERYGHPSHQVRIEYYPPRGDAKEAWDVVDFLGAFGLPMSIRLNLQGRDSILAAPMVIDLARWLAVLGALGRKGPVPELGFFFKNPVGEDPPQRFSDQLAALDRLKGEVAARLT